MFKNQDLKIKSYISLEDYQGNTVRYSGMESIQEDPVKTALGI